MDNRMILANSEKRIFDIVIPAFDLNHQGVAVHLKLVAELKPHFKMVTNGKIAKSLEKSFIRVVHILSSLKYSWRCLEDYHYRLTSFDENFNVRDARSADLALCIAAMNVIRTHYQKNPIDNYIGTGSLRVDGSFNETFLEEVKEKAIYRTNTYKKFISTKSCNHIFDLEALFEGCLIGEKNEVENNGNCTNASKCSIGSTC
jgi:hypothetical protein